MEKLKRRLVVFPLAALLILSVIATGFAAGSPSLGAAYAATAIPHVSNRPTVPVAASSELIPIERSEGNINGEMIINETLEVSATTDPNAVIKPNFELNGCLYAMHSIVKTPFIERDEKDVSLAFQDTTNTADMGANLQKLPYSMPYEVDGYVGELYLNPQTVSTVATSQKTKSSTKREVQTYNLEMNDPTLVPQNYNGLPLNNLSWAPSGYLEDSSIPSGYVATATYSRTSSWKVDTSWSLTATYEGTVVREDTSKVRYTVAYKGTPIPKGYGVIDGQIVKIPHGYSIINGELVRTSYLPSALQMVGILLILVLLASGVLFLLWATKKGLIATRKIIVQAQDDATGEYSVIQKVKVSKKAPSFALDTLRAPSSKHFLCEISAKQAMVLRGKIINISADGRLVCKHKVEPQVSTDKYVFSVDLELVDSGPIDHSEL